MQLRSGRVLSFESNSKKNQNAKKYIRKTEKIINEIEQKIINLEGTNDELNKIYEQVIEISKEIIKANILYKDNWNYFSDFLFRIEKIKTDIKRTQMQLNDYLKEIENYYTKLDISLINLEDEYDKLKENIGELILIQLRCNKEHNIKIYLAIDKILKSLNVWEIFLANLI